MAEGYCWESAVSGCAEGRSPCTLLGQAPVPVLQMGNHGGCPDIWIPAPRFHEDKLRGNDKRGAGEASCRESEGVPQISL